ncbi:MAG: hypothetical protein ABFD89_28855 [Bryobacteraceae bacterium]
MTSTAYPTPPVPEWLNCYLGPNFDPEYQVQFKKTNGDPHWTSNKGSQTWPLLCPFDEIVIGGQRGGGKSAVLIAWFAMGDPTLDPSDPAHGSFLNDPSFRGLILRKEYQSMGEFVDEAMDFFRPFGVKKVDDPVEFHFKTGAKIYTNHLGNPEAYEKYRGHGLTKIGIEELTQIPQESWYLKLFGSLRGKKQFRIVKGKTVAPLRCQIMSTCNPDGPGKLWVKKRLVKVYDDDGQLIARNTPMRDQITGLSRIFIPMSLNDNPYLRENMQYKGMLLSQDEVTRKQWMDGDWDAGSGQFFDQWRPDGPINAEEREKMPWARHVPTETPVLRPWWFRWGSLDVGYDHPATMHKFCRNSQDKRLHVYSELSLRRMDSYELGVLLAKWWMPELEQLPDHQVVLYVSPDAFAKTSSQKTEAEMVAMGIQEVLGPYGAMLMRFNAEERSMLASSAERARMMFDARKEQFKGAMGIALKPADDARKAGCAYITHLLQFRPTLIETEQELKERLQSTFSRSGVEAYERELSKAKVADPDPLPRIQVWPCCTELIRCMGEAVRGEAEKGQKTEEYLKWDAVDGVGGDDALDDFRYGCMGYKEVEKTIPREYFVGERMTAFQENQVANFGEEMTDLTRLRMVAMTQSAQYDQAVNSAPKSFSFGRASSTRHRVN